MRSQENQSSKLSFYDSWKQPVAEVALGAALVGTGVFLGTRGDASMIYKSIKKNSKNLQDKVNKYIDPKIGAVPRFIKNVALKAIPNIYEAAKKQKDSRYTADTLSDFLQTEYHKIDLNKLDEEAASRYQAAKNKSLFNFLRKGGKESEFQFKPKVEYFINQVKQEKMNELINPVAKGNNENKGGAKGIFKKTMNPADFITGALFASGISAWHAVDKRINPEQSKKNKEVAFQLAGSKFSQNTNFQKKYNKQKSPEWLKMKSEIRVNRDIEKNAGAGTTAVYDSLTGLLSRIPQSATWGAGMTGVTIGSAALLNEHPELLRRPSVYDNINQQNEENSKEKQTPSVIIVDPFALNSINKQASILNRLQEFGANILGRHNEIRGLERNIQNVQGYKDQIIEAMKASGKTPEEIVAEEFGTLASEKVEKDLFHALVESKAGKLKEDDVNNLEKIKDARNKDRLIAGAIGTGILGSGGAAMYANYRKKEGNKNGENEKNTTQ